MKTLLLFTLFLSAFGAQAGTKILSEREVTLPVDVSTAKLKRSNAGYGDLFLVKILVPELAAETIMNHRNSGESAPCLATYGVNSVERVIQGRPGIENAVMKITLVKDFHLNGDKCTITLSENIRTEIRGFVFVHSRSTESHDRVPEDCQ